MNDESQRKPGRVPPYDSKAERAVLGAALLNNLALGQVSGKLDAADFYVEAHRRIYLAMLELAGRGEAIDPVTLGSELNRSGDMARIGSAIALNDLTNAVATIQNVEHYATIVSKKAAVRRMIYAAQQVVADGFAAVDDEDEYLSSARSAVATAAQFVSGGVPQQIDDDLVEIMNELQQQGDPPGLVKTGIAVIDRVTGGLWPGILHVLAARPSMGKSALAINIATNAALAGYKTVYVTMEDTRNLIIRRLVARYADIDLHDLNLRNVKSPEQWRRVIAAMTRLSKRHPLWIEDACGLTSAAVAQIAAAHKAVHGLQLLVIDHLGEYADTGESETSITTRAAQRSRDIAKELNIPVVLVAQLNRKVEERADKRPLLSDLRQSGAIEQVARVVWFLYRPAYYMGDQEAEGRRDLQLLVAKATHGKTGLLKLWIDLSRMYARSWDVTNDGSWPDDDAAQGKPGKTKKDYFGSRPGPHWSDTDDKGTEY